MKTKLAVTVLAICAALAPVLSFAADDKDSDRTHPKVFVKDSAITMKIKTKLAADHLGSLAHVHVDTDANGVVWLSGYVRTQKQMDNAVSMATTTEHVVSVKNNLKIKKDD
jgi:hyperosmotically inducible protein